MYHFVKTDRTVVPGLRPSTRTISLRLPDYPSDIEDHLRLVVAQRAKEEVAVIGPRVDDELGLHSGRAERQELHHNRRRKLLVNTRPAVLNRWPALDR